MLRLDHKNATSGHSDYYQIEQPYNNPPKRDTNQTKDTNYEPNILENDDITNSLCQNTTSEISPPKKKQFGKNHLLWKTQKKTQNFLNSRARKTILNHFRRSIKHH